MFDKDERITYHKFPAVSLSSYARLSSSSTAFLIFVCLHDSSQIAAALAGETAQTIAVVLRFLPAGKSAAVMKRLDAGLRGETAKRLAATGEVPTAVVAGIEEVLRKKFANISPAVRPGL
ncbi:MAG: hypothetical protein AB1742_06055 [bacterium]